MRRVSSAFLALATVTLLSCGDDGPTGPTTGELQVTLDMTGEDLDPDGCQVSVDGGSPSTITRGSSVIFSDLEPGTHSILLEDVSSNCTVAGSNPRSVSVIAGNTSETTFSITCAALVGDLTVTTTTTGEDLDPDGYTVTVDGGLEQSAASNESVTFSNLSVGDHTVLLTGVASNCAVSGPNPRTVTVVYDEPAQITFAITCVENTGQIRVAAVTMGGDIDPDGYVAAIDGGARTTRIDPDGETGFAHLAAGDHTVELRDVAANCSVAGENPRTVSVDSGETVRTTFNVDCLKADLIVFTTDRDGNWEIYVMNPDGTNPVNLTDHSADDYFESWSLDGTQIAFTSDRGGSHARYVMNADGTEVSKLSDYAYGVLSPDWARIAVAEGDLSRGFELYVMNVDGTGSIVVARNGDTMDWPEWSSDGTRILFYDESDGDNCFSVSRADGTGYVFRHRCLTDTFFGGFTWSPDGTRIIFSEEPISDHLDDIFVMNADATGVVNLTNEVGADDYDGVFSPDGAEIAFLSNRDGICGVYLMNADGSDQRILAELSCAELFGRPVPPVESLTWSPDGTRIAFVLFDSDADIYGVNTETTGLVNLTDHPAADRSPEWRP